MQPRFYDNEYILIQGDFCQELLLMQKGFALMGFHDENDNFVICQNFSSGIIIGESSVFLKMPSFASYKAYEVEAMAIPDHAVTKILREKYPTRMLNYMDIVRNRTASLMASVEGHEGYIKTDTRHKLMWQMSIKSAEEERFISHNKRLKDIYKKFKEMKKQLKDMHDEILIIKGPE
jgi:CRP-like cAMP-binding protein